MTRERARAQRFFARQSSSSQRGADLLAETHDHAGAAPGRLTVAARASGIGSATPLAWTHAQFIRLALCVKHGRVLETPDVVRAHFSGRR